MAGTASKMFFIAIHKSVDLIAIWGWRFIMAMLAMIKICLFPVSEACLTSHFTISQFIDIIAIRLGSYKSISFAKRILIFSGRGVERRLKDLVRIDAGE